MVYSDIFLSQILDEKVVELILVFFGSFTAFLS